MTALCFHGTPWKSPWNEHHGGTTGMVLWESPWKHHGTPRISMTSTKAPWKHGNPHGCTMGVQLNSPWKQALWKHRGSMNVPTEAPWKSPWKQCAIASMEHLVEAPWTSHGRWRHHRSTMESPWKGSTTELPMEAPWKRYAAMEMEAP